MFDFIAYPLANLLLLLYNFLGHQTVIAIAVLTILIRLLILPLTLGQQRSSQKMRELQPKIDELREKYSDNQEKLAEEQMKLWRKAGVNPAGGCLPVLIQLPIMIGLYRAITYCVPSTPLQLFQFSQNIYKWLPGIEGLVPLQSTFLGMDLGQPPSPDQWWSYALPLLAFVTSWLQQKMLSPTLGGSGDGQSQTEMMTQQMQIMMPLMFGFIALQYATGLAFYFIISNLVGIAQYYFINNSQEDDSSDLTPQPRKRPKQ